MTMSDSKPTLRRNGFTFKKFFVAHDRCAMKVGTDGILLGAWAPIAHVTRVLDIGTGSGLLALMLAQRYPQAKITGVELDRQAFLQAKENVQNSPFSAQITLFCQDIAQFAENCKSRFDLIVSNPPYFEQGCNCRDNSRNLARYTNAPHLQWLNIAASLLTKNGKICFVLPFDAGKTLQKQTALCCEKQCEIITKAGKVPQRLLLSFSKQNQLSQASRLVVYNENNQYSQEFVQLTRNFYLNF